MKDQDNDIMIHQKTQKNWPDILIMVQQQKCAWLKYASHMRKICGFFISSTIFIQH